MRFYNFFLLSVLTFPQAFTQVNKELTYYSDSSKYDVKYYKLEISTNTDSLYISGNTLIKAVAEQNNFQSFYIELSISFTVDSILFNQKKATFTHSQNWIKANMPFSVARGQMFIAEVFYKGYPSSSRNFGGISIDSYEGAKALFTLSEPFASLDFFACKQLLTDKADSVTVVLTVPEGLTGVANGILAEKKTLPGNLTSFRWETRYPVAYYLIAIVVGDYKEYSYKFFDKYCNDSVLFQNFYYNVPDYLAEQKIAIDKTIEIIELFEESTGIAYPFYKEKYGHVTAPIGGGMENQTISMMDNFNFNLVAHELAHSWFGNMVTCSDWQNIWINEGFASYLEYYANEKIDPEYAKVWLSNCYRYALQNPETSVFVPEEEKWDESRIFSYYDSYKKGAAIIHMIRKKLKNDSVFFKTINTFLNQYAYSNASADDFRDVLERITKTDWEQFFKQWFYGKGYPVVNIEGNAAARKLALSIGQNSSSADNTFIDLKLEMKVIFKNRPDSSIILDISKKNQNYKFHFVDVVTSVVFDPERNILAKINSVVDIDSTSIVKTTVAPNPFNDRLVIEFPDTGKDKMVKLVSLSGKIMGEWQSKAPVLKLTINFIEPGPYVLLANDGVSITNFKLVKIF